MHTIVVCMFIVWGIVTIIAVCNDIVYGVNQNSYRKLLVLSIGLVSSYVAITNAIELIRRLL